LTREFHDIAITQRPALESAEIGTQLGGATVENNWNIDSARDRNPASASNLSAAKFQFVTSLNMGDMAGWQWPRSNLHLKFAAAPCYASLIFKSQLQTAQCDFEPGDAFIISNQQIRYA
jgi:hypothetical protein